MGKLKFVGKKVLVIVRTVGDLSEAYFFKNATAAHTFVDAVIGHPDQTFDILCSNIAFLRASADRECQPHRQYDGDTAGLSV